MTNGSRKRWIRGRLNRRSKKHYGIKSASARTLVTVPIKSAFNFTLNRCSNKRHTVMCSNESHVGVFPMDDSGPISASGTSSAVATSSITALILLSVINLFSVSNAAIWIVGNRYKAVQVVKVGRDVVFTGGYVLSDDAAMTVKSA